MTTSYAQRNLDKANARQRALSRLAAEHPDRYDELIMEERAKINRAGEATCPACGIPVLVRIDGGVRKHRESGKAGRCPGSGKAPIIREE